MIREATEHDIPSLLQMGQRFADVAQLGQIAAFDADSMERTFRFLIESPDGILLVTDGGAAGGLVHSAYWNLDHRMGQEMFWWVDPERRGRIGANLMRALEVAAKLRGARSWTMIALEASEPDRVGRMYERAGYRATERSYVRSL